MRAIHGNARQNSALLLGCLLASVAFGQSLGEIAKQEREKKASQTATGTTRVYTNDNLGIGGTVNQIAGGNGQPSLPATAADANKLTQARAALEAEREKLIQLRQRDARWTIYLANGEAFPSGAVRFQELKVSAAERVLDDLERDLRQKQTWRGTGVDQDIWNTLSHVERLGPYELASFTLGALDSVDFPGKDRWISDFHSATQSWAVAAHEFLLAQHNYGGKPDPDHIPDIRVEGVAQRIDVANRASDKEKAARARFLSLMENGRARARAALGK